MAKKLYILLFLFTVLSAQDLYAQFPQYLSYSDENGLPSNEIYSIVQDKKGFVWFGSDAGLFKFDGVRYSSYKCKTQNAKSITGLTISSLGKIYCYNFQSQIFFLENDSLKELLHACKKISSIVCDHSGNLIVNHNEGISVYNESSKQWLNYLNFTDKNKNKRDLLYTNSVRLSNANIAYFITCYGIGKIEHNKLFISERELFSSFQTSGTFILECFNDEVWLFSVNKNIIYRIKNEKVQQITDTDLNRALQNKKITNVRSLADGNLWICTYAGILQYNPSTTKVQIYYPDVSFSNCLIDRERNYWFTTLQSGMMRIPDLNYMTWTSFENNKLSKLETDGKHIFYTATNGVIRKLNPENNELKSFQANGSADIQCLNYDVGRESLFFYINNNLYALNKNERIDIILEEVPPTKFLTKAGKHYILCSSFGTYIYDIDRKKQAEKKILSSSRQALFDSKKDLLWLAGNSGLYMVDLKNESYILSDSFLLKKQVVSIDMDTVSQKLYILTFDGKIFLKTNGAKPVPIAHLPEDILPYQLIYYKDNLLIATNHGLWIYNLPNQKFETLNTLSGLASNNIQDVLVLNGNLWLATGKGLQKIPLTNKTTKSLAKVYLKKFLPNNLLALDYRQMLVLFPEASSYSSDGDFEYAYRINGNEWVRLPSSIEKIEIQNLPTGPLMVELKAIDHLGRNSENVVMVSGYVNSPFWQKWWFFALIGVLLFFLVFLFLKNRIKKLKQKQLKEIERITLENELRLTQQSALKAQMNPHFIFNVLNSIKGYIYENDKKNATLYLSRFSDLIRKILEQSSAPQIKLREEIEFLKVYIELEAMLIQDDFQYSISIDENVDTTNLKIPALLIQPYVENAFKHGLRHKNGNKELNITIKLNEYEECLVITIDDNGIGREASVQLKSQHNNTHQSFATEATAKRIELLNSSNKNYVSVHVIDKITNDNLPLGTRILLTIVINDENAAN